MNSKFYVSLEAARLLKEKGYNEATDYSIDEDNCMMDSRYVLNKDLSECVCSCPTKAEAIDWLEGKGIVIETQYNVIASTNTILWGYSIYINDKDGLLTNMITSWREDIHFSTRLEAEEAAIIKALELL